MKNIVITNDDGIDSYGYRLLYDSLHSLGKIYLFAPESPKSATGLSITLHKPLRVNRKKFVRTYAYVVSGNPSDIVHLAMFKIVKKIDLLASGINLGDNTSIQVILSSGTIGAAIQAALFNIPAIAFSTAISDEIRLIKMKEYCRILKRYVRNITEWVIENGLPEKCDVLNVNFPDTLRENTEIVFTKPAKLRFLEKIIERKDPRGKPYYWIYGEVLEETEKNTDVHVLWIEKNISITPLSIGFHVYFDDKYNESMKNFIKEKMNLI